MYIHIYIQSLCINMKQIIEIITFLILCSMVEYIPVGQSVSLKQFDPDNEALINEYFSSEKVDEAAEHCLRLIGSKTIVSHNNHNYNNDENDLSYTTRKLKWRHCILKELDRINRGLFSWNIGSLFNYNKDMNTIE
ncbi:unnamed protein product [Schistosoma margrebowiei]|uniref:Uncharacterized protein n=1 Tax=Schistosoma margrebowiei TaxID=48269 RepID=A0AA84ZDP8_9TREM|nr:unnamed protein product [Schistosoma margrebowiei]